MNADLIALGQKASLHKSCSSLRRLSKSEAALVNGGWVVPVGGFVLSLAGRLSARTFGSTILSQVSLGLSTFGLATFFGGGGNPPRDPRKRG